MPISAGACRTIEIYALSYTRWKSLLTCCSASMCSTAQSPRARKAFSRACAARTCPAPDVADSNNTRGFVFICLEIPRMQEASRCFALARGDFFQNPASDFLEFAEASEVILKIVVQELRVLRAEFRSQNHVTQLYWMREQRVFLQFLERNLGVVVIHGFPQRKRPFPPIVLNCCSNSPVAVLAGFDAHDFANAANTYIARLRDLLGKCDYEINLAADFEIGRGKKVQPAITDIPRMGVQLAALILARKNAHGKAHRESPCLAAFRSISHQNPLGLWTRRKANIGPCKLQRENQEILS